jgi:hypothetical protein
MTEAEWLNCNDLDRLLSYLRDRVSARKFRLFAAACCRRVWDLLPDESSRGLVGVLEQYADGLVGARDLEAARRVSMNPAWYATECSRPDSAWNAARDTARAARCLRTLSTPAGEPVVRERQVPLLRCIVGNPFRPVSLERSWLAHAGGAALALARSIDEDCRWSDLPFLGDVLEEAGCTDEGILSHCRETSEHARGCWVVDLVLGRQ